MIVLLYAACFAAANIITAKTAPAEVGPFLVTWGTWVIGATFVLRDVIQLRHGKRAAYCAIVLGAVAAAATSAILGDTLWVVAGSLVAVALGESLDTEVFTRMGGRLPARVAVSGVVGGALDSAAFVLVALSPWTSGIVPWSVVPNAILGVALAKAAMQLAAGLAWRAARGPEPLPEAAR